MKRKKYNTQYILAFILISKLICAINGKESYSPEIVHFRLRPIRHEGPDSLEDKMLISSEHLKAKLEDNSNPWFDTIGHVVSKKGAKLKASASNQSHFILTTSVVTLPPKRFSSAYPQYSPGYAALEEIYPQGTEIYPEILVTKFDRVRSETSKSSEESNSSSSKSKSSSTSEEDTESLSISMRNNEKIEKETTFYPEYSMYHNMQPPVVYMPIPVPVVMPSPIEFNNQENENTESTIESTNTTTLTSGSSTTNDAPSTTLETSPTTTTPVQTVSFTSESTSTTLSSTKSTTNSSSKPTARTISATSTTAASETTKFTEPSDRSGLHRKSNIDNMVINAANFEEYSFLNDNAKSDNEDLKTLLELNSYLNHASSQYKFNVNIENEQKTTKDDSFDNKQEVQRIVGFEYLTGARKKSQNIPNGEALSTNSLEFTTHKLLYMYKFNEKTLPDFHRKLNFPRYAKT